MPNPAILNKKRRVLQEEEAKLKVRFERSHSDYLQNPNKSTKAALSTARRDFNEAKNKLRKFNKANPPAVQS